MIIKLPIKPISVNAAFQGKRFKTKECKDIDETLALLLMGKEKVVAEYYSVTIFFYLKNFANTDEDNLVKIVQDNLVRAGIISDDRRICHHELRKFPADEDCIFVEILPMEKPCKIKAK